MPVVRFKADTPCLLLLLLVGCELSSFVFGRLSSSTHHSNPHSVNVNFNANVNVNANANAGTVHATTSSSFPSAVATSTYGTGKFSDNESRAGKWDDSDSLEDSYVKRMLQNTYFHDNYAPFAASNPGQTQTTAAQGMYAGTSTSDNRTMLLPIEEMTALKDLYKSLNGPKWRYTGHGFQWTFLDDAPPSRSSPFSSLSPSPSPCSFEGIVCTCNSTAYEYHINGDYNAYYYSSSGLPQGNAYACRVYKIFLSKHNLQGTLPASLFTSFRNLSRLHLGFNNITGTIPSYRSPSLAASPQFWSDFQLFFLDLSANSITGSIPSWFGNLEYLAVFNVQVNSLSGLIPPELGLQKSRALSYIAFNNNQIEGSIPDTICNLHAIQLLRISFNKLRAALPSCIQSLTLLKLLSIRSNQISGPFPTFVSSLTKLVFLGLGGNAFSPSKLPSALQTLESLEAFVLYNAGLSGTVPSALSRLTKLQLFRVDGNKLTGPIPTFLCRFPKLINIQMEYNRFQGSLPSCFGQSQSLQTLSLYNNALTGTIPNELTALRSLVSLLLSNNFFHGALIPFNPAIQRNVSFIDISANAITGTLHSTIFKLESLTILATSLNCMHGTLPKTLCEATNLKSLFLVGIQAAAVCSAPVFELSAGEASFESSKNGLVSRGVVGTIPACLFALPQLGSLALDGNRLTGSLSISLGISSTLTRISLSHNGLVGTIPLEIQLRSAWQLLDLSFNRLSGTLDARMYLSSNSELDLIVNKISGDIPHGLLHLQTISILKGNYFDCSHDAVVSDQSLLPPNDPDHSIVNCGSNDTNLALFVWLAAFIVIVVTGMISKFNATTSSLAIDAISSQHSNPRYSEIVFEHLRSEGPSIAGIYSKALNCLNINRLFVYLAGYHVDAFLTEDVMNAGLKGNICEFEEIMRSLRWIFLWMTLLLFGVYLPVLYVPLSLKYGSLTVEYAWQLSAAFDEGSAPAIALTVAFVLYLAFLRIFLTISLRHRRVIPKQLEDASPENLGDFRHPVHPGLATVDMADMMAMAKPSNSVLHRLRLFGVLFINTVVVVGVNALYVVATLSADGLALAAFSFGLSLFKIVFPHLIPKQGLFSYSPDEDTSAKKLERDKRNLSVQLTISLLNTIVIPCVATICLSPNCAFYIFTPPPELSTTYSIPQCASYALSLKCAFYSYSKLTLAFTPPFEYGFTCSNTLMTSYVSVFVYLFFVLSFVFPFAGVLTFYFRKTIPIDSNTGQRTHPLMYDFATWILTICGPVYETNDLPPLHRLRNHLVRWVAYGFTSCTKGIGLPMEPPSWLICCASVPGGSAEIRYFKKIEYLVGLYQICALSASFGLIFPPLCLLGLVAVFAKTFVMQVMIKQFIADAKQDMCNKPQNNERSSLPLPIEVLKVNFDGMWDLFKQAYWWVLPTSAGFCSFFVFDILGSKIGAAFAVPVLCVLLFVPFLIYVISKAAKKRKMLMTQITAFMDRNRWQSAAKNSFIGNSEPVVHFGMPSIVGGVELTVISNTTASPLERDTSTNL